MNNINQRIANELNVAANQVNAAVALLDEGATVPFIARYRKEVTGGLDDTQMRFLEERLGYLRDMEDRRATILKSIDEQGKLTPELKNDLLMADTKTRLEDLYLPYKPKRRTKAQIAREAGLQGLADALLADPSLDPEALATDYLNPELAIATTKDALDGAKQILMETFAEDASLLGKLRQFLWDNALVTAVVVAGHESTGEKFRDYFEHSEPLKSVPSHRALALFRGRKAGVLTVALRLPDENESLSAVHPCEIIIGEHHGIRDAGRAADRWLREVVRWTWRVKLLTHLETDLLGQVRDSAEDDAIKVFGANLKDLLLTAAAGQKATIGLDPGLRTGVKVAVIDATGKVVDHCAIFPNPPQNKIAESAKILVNLCKKHNVALISIGNGTASRETDRFVGEVLKLIPDMHIKKVMVNEAGASIYSASEYAAREFPDLDVTIRGAVSIARRLQDPLAELVKIDPKSIGVGQYQHDVNQTQLARTLDAVVEDCVNAVGVDLNTASIPLLSRVSGLNTTLATNIVDFRDQHGAFGSRRDLLNVPRFGEKTFELAAGFLRVAGDNPLDNSAVHPESYPVVERIANNSGRQLNSIIGDVSFLRALKPQDFITETVGLPTIKDILSELEKPGRDPRPEFVTADFKEGVESIKDLEPGMILEGVISNVTNFGAFVDIGVHQDGLVHISALSDKFVKDPREVVKAGDIVKVKVIEVEVPRKRIALSMRLDDEIGQKTSERPQKPAARQNMTRQDTSSASTMGSMGALLQQAMKKK
jgi:protein Tex